MKRAYPEPPNDQEYLAIQRIRELAACSRRETELDYEDESTLFRQLHSDISDELLKVDPKSVPFVVTALCWIARDALKPTKGS